jgi:hypothetical protein
MTQIVNNMKNIFILFAGSAVIIALFGSCASMTGYLTGRTVGRNQAEIMGSLNYSQTPEFDFDSDDTTDVDNFGFPNVELGFRYGVAEKVDLGLRMNSNLNILLDARFQVLGDQHSPAALSLGFGAGTFGLFVALWNVQLPLYLSFHPTEYLDIYVSPRYIAQFASGDIGGSLNYLGGNAGILFGRRVRFGFDAGIYDVGTKGESIRLPTFGFGVKIPLNGEGGNGDR